MAVTSFFNPSLENAYSKSSKMLLLLFTCFARFGKGQTFPLKNIIADRNYHFFVLAGAPASNIWHKICAEIPTASRPPTGVSLPSDIFILYMADVTTTSIVLFRSSIRRRRRSFLIIIQSF